MELGLLSSCSLVPKGREPCLSHRDMGTAMDPVVSCLGKAQATPLVHRKQLIHKSQVLKYLLNFPAWTRV